MASRIETFLNRIATAIYGSEVRDSIHDSIKECYDNVTAGKTLADAAAENANSAASSVNSAKQNANNAASAANSAATNANNAASAANTAKENANSAASSANTAKQNANNAASAANTAATAANEAATAANEAATAANEAKENANMAAQNAAATLVSHQVQYKSSGYGQTIPTTGEWHDSIPGVSPGNYLWTRVTCQFNTGEPIVFYSVARMGVNGLGSVVSVCDVEPDSNGNVTLTAADVGARSAEWMPTAADVGARPSTWTPSASDVGARSAEWMPTAADVGARPSTWTPSASDVGARSAEWMPTAADVGALSASVVSNAWNSSTTYAEGDYCIYNNKLYRCKSYGSNKIPTDAYYWTEVTITSAIQAGGAIVAGSGTLDSSYVNVDYALSECTYVKRSGLVVVHIRARASTTTTSFTLATGFPRPAKNLAHGIAVVGAEAAYVQILSGGAVQVDANSNPNGKLIHANFTYLARD